MKRYPGVRRVLDPASSMNGLPGMRGVKLVTEASAAVLLMAYAGLTPALADTIEAALVRAYQNNPSLNSQRASVRVTDENVPQALSGYRPKVNVTASGGEQSLSSTAKVVGPTILPGAVATYFTQSGFNSTYGAGASVTQTIFNGFQTANKTRQAEAQVL